MGPKAPGPSKLTASKSSNMCFQGVTGMKRLRNLFRFLAVRPYGKANTPKSSAASAGPARKQSLMTKKKSIAAQSSRQSGQTAGQAVLQRISSLTDALFEPSQTVQILPDPAAPDERAILVPYDDPSAIQEDPDPEIAEKEALIHQTWTRHCAKTAHEERARECRLVISRAKALQALKSINEKWYAEAVKLDYSHAPSNRRIATLTMPSKINISSGHTILDAENE